MNRRSLGPLLLGAALLASVGLVPSPLTAQESGADAPKPQATTADDPEVPIEVLKKLLRAPTQEELAVEAEAWRDLVRAKVEEIAQTEIASLEKKEDMAEAEAQANAEAEETGAETGTAAQQAEAESAAKDQLNETLAKLNEEKASLLERFGIVLDAWEKKGGDPSAMRTYANAVSGIQVEVKDAGATAAAVKGWLTSKEGGIKWGIRILQFAGIMLAFWILAGIIGSIVRKATSMHKDMSALLRAFINKFVRRLILLIGLLVALSTIGVKVGALLALIGGGAFIIGFALQDTLGNFAAGLMLLIYRPFDEGDVVSVGGVTGKVKHVSLVSTTIVTPDNQIILVPNKNVWGQVITNVTGSKERRVDMVFGVGYDDDLGKAQAILEKVVSEHEKVLKDPAPVIKVNELGAFSVDFICRPWTKTGDYWEVYWDITRRVKEEFDANGISIPFPQQDVHMHQVPAKA